MPIYCHQGKLRKCYYFKFSIAGRVYKKAIPEARNERQAAQVEALARQAVYENRYLRFVGTITFERFVRDIYLSWAAHKRSLQQEKWYCEMLVNHPRFKGKLLEDFSQVLIEQFRQDRKANTRFNAPRSLNTINREMAVLRKILEIAVGNGYLDRNPALLVPSYSVEGRRTRVLTSDEDRIMLTEAFTGRKARILPIAVLARYTGMRRGEMLSLQREWLDFDHRNIMLPKAITKNQVAREIPMCQTVFDVLSERAGRELVFSGYPSKCHTSSLFTDGMKAAGIHGVTLHTLRHTLSSQLEDIGVRQKEIRDIIGHKPKDSTEHYQHSTFESRQKAIELLEQSDPLACGIEGLQYARRSTEAKQA